MPLLGVPRHDQPPAGAPAEVQLNWARMSHTARLAYLRRATRTERPASTPQERGGYATPAPVVAKVAEAVTASPDADPAEIAAALGMTIGATYSRVRAAAELGLLPEEQRTRYGRAYRAAKKAEQ